MDSTPRTDDLLSRHGAFLRRLAGELTRCEADAEDLVQSTWAEALRRPPLHWQSPRAWLAQVARRLAGKRVRTDTRRSRREAQAAQHERVEADLDLSLVLGELSQALAKLEPKQRRVVVARYFEGRELRAIAAEEGVSLSTVKARLARAHRELRRSLDGGVGRERWLGAFGPLLAPPTSPFLSHPVLPAAAGALAMTATVKIASAAGLAGLLALGLFHMGGAPAAGLEPGLEAPKEPVHAAVAAASPAPQGERTVVAAATAEEVAPDEVPAKALPIAGVDVTVTDSFGVAAEDVKVFAAPEGLPLNMVGETNKKGRLEVRWRTASAGRIIVGVRANSRWLGGLRRFDIGPGQTRQLELAVHPDLLPRKNYSRVLSGGSLGRLSLVALSTEVPTPLLTEEPAEPKLPRRLSPIRPESIVNKTDDTHSFSACGPAVAAHDVAGLRTGSFYGYVENQMETVEGEGKISGAVRDAFGDPVADVEFSLRRKGGWGGERGGYIQHLPPLLNRTNGQGGFELSIPDGTYELKVPSKGDVQIKVDVHISAGGVTNWQGVLDLGTRLWGRTMVSRASGDDGKKMPLVAAVAPRPGGLWIGITKPDKEGNFSMPFCPAETLDVDFTFGKSCTPVLHIEGARTDAIDWTVPVDLESLSIVSFQPLDSAPNAAAASELRVWDRRTGRGWSGKAPGRQGDSISLSIAPGDWDLEVRPRGLVAETSATTFSVLDARPVDLGAIAMPSIGWLNLPRKDAGATWRVERAKDGVRVFEGKLPETDDVLAFSLEVAPGEYLVTPFGEDSEPRTLAVQAGHHANW